MISLLAALVAAGSPEPDADFVGRSEWIFSTVQHSEFCHAGNVRLDLRTGRYALVARAARRDCDDPRLERPVTTGRLDPKRLAAIRTAYRRVLAEGLESQACRDGVEQDRIVVSNGGTPILVLSTPRATGSAPDDLTCWSEAASALHQALDDLFPPPVPTLGAGGRLAEPGDTYLGARGHVPFRGKGTCPHSPDGRR